MIGLMWFDNDTKSDLAAKVERAATYYQKKYGKRPDLCYIHPTMEPTVKPGAGNDAGLLLVGRQGNIEVRTTRSVLPNHLWIGVDSNQAQGGSA